MSRRKNRRNRAAYREIARLSYQDQAVNTPMRCDEIESYWRDPSYYDAEIAENRRVLHAAIDAGMAPLNAVQAERWVREDRA